MTIKTMKLSAIKPLVSNPPSRTSDAAIHGLREFIRARIEHGLPPLPASERLLIGSDGQLGDGHRRRAALMAEGVKDVDVEIDPTRTAAEIWRDRASAKPPNSAQVSQAAKLGLSQEFFPAPQRRNATDLIKLAGEDGYRAVIESGVSLAVVKPLAALVRYTVTDGDREFALEALRWMIGHKMQRPAINAIAMGTRPATLVRAIKENRPLRIE